MNEKERLINKIIRLLSTIETLANQSVIREVEGLLDELRNS